MKTSMSLTTALVVSVLLAFGQRSERTKWGLFPEFYQKIQSKQLHQSASEGSTPRSKFWDLAFSQNPGMKSSIAAIQKLDSTITRRYEEEEWVVYSKDEFTFDTSGYITRMIEYYWDEAQWVEDWKAEIIYNVQGNMTLGVTFYWDETKWVEEWKAEVTYDANGNKTLGVEYYWDETQWVEDRKEEITYDSSGNMTEEIVYYWEEAQWAASWKIEYTYDLSGNITQRVTYYMDGTEWVEDLKIEYTYNSSGKMTVETVYEWEEAQWVVYWKVEYAYDSGGNITQRVAYKKDETGWVAKYKSDYTYDGNGNPTMEESYILDDELNQFIANSKYEYTYDISYNLSDLLLPPLLYFLPDFADQIFNKPLEYFSYIPDSIVMVNSRKGTYYYSDQSASINETKTGMVGIYPNPVTELLYFNIDENYKQITFELYDLQGRRLVHKNVLRNESINLENLTKGIYIFNIVVDGNTQIGKLIKQ